MSMKIVNTMGIILISNSLSELFFFFIYPHCRLKPQRQYKKGYVERTHTNSNISIYFMYVLGQYTTFDVKH